MPIRKQTARMRRIGNQDIEQLRGMIAAGIPWDYNMPNFNHRGAGDLILLVNGFVYLLDYMAGHDDIETAIELWSELREPIIEQHIRHKPGSRPWAWWALEDREPRRRLSDRPCGCVALPEHDQKFPPMRLNWFGHPRFCQCEYESEQEYFQRGL